MRKALTGPEYLLWERLKVRSGDGLVFRRQHPLGSYVVDFYCFKARLVVEVDGALHGEDAQAAKDDARDNWLREQGLEIYRIPAAEVYRDVDGIAEGVRLLAIDRAAER
jgi:very-short-patch-repair endonuclease